MEIVRSGPGVRLGACVGIVALAMAVMAGCGGDDDSGEEAADVPEDREALIAEFPADAQELLTDDIPTEVIGALLQTRQQGPETLVLKDSGGELFEAEAAAWADDWETITGWSVQNASPVATPGDLRAQVARGRPEWDMLEIGSLGEAKLMEDNDLLDPLDSELLESVTAEFPEEYQYTDHWIQYSNFGVLLIWDTRIWPEDGDHPESAIEDLFNTEEYPGNRCLFNYPQFAGTLEYPLLADGVAPDELYPLDTERALNKLEEIEDDIVYWESGAESVQFVVSGECAMGVAWHGRPALRLKENPDLPVGVSWEDALLIDAAYGIPRGAEYADAANSLIAYAFTPQKQCAFINEIGYGIPIDEGCIDDFGRQWGVTEENRALTSVEQDADYYQENIDELTDTFNNWLTQ